MEREEGVPEDVELPVDGYYIDFVFKGAKHYKKGKDNYKYVMKRATRVLHSKA